MFFFLRDLIRAFSVFLFSTFYSKIANCSLCQTSRRGFQVGYYYILQVSSIFHKAGVREWSQPDSSTKPLSSFLCSSDTASLFFIHKLDSCPWPLHAVVETAVEGDIREAENPLSSILSGAPAPLFQHIAEAPFPIFAGLSGSQALIWCFSGGRGDCCCLGRERENRAMQLLRNRAEVRK